MHTRAPRTAVAVSRTVDLTVRWSAPPPPHTALGRAVKVAGLFVSLPRTCLLLLLLVLLHISPSRRLLRGLRRRRPQCSSIMFRMALLRPFLPKCRLTLAYLLLFF